MQPDPRIRDVADVSTAHLFDLVDDLDPPLDFGSGPFGRRVLFGSAGGTFTGPDLHGDVLANGGDWALVREDGTIVLDVRLTLRTHDGALIHMTYGGRIVTPPEHREAMDDRANRHLVDPSNYYIRTNPLFETGSERYSWLNDIVAVGYGYLIEGGIAYRVSRIT